MAVEVLKLIAAAVLVLWVTAAVAIAGADAGLVGAVAPLAVLGLGVWWLVTIARRPRKKSD